MQFIVISEQLKNIAFAAFFGCIWGFIYDIIHTVRVLFIYDFNKSLKKIYKLLFIHILDLIYFVLFSVSYCIFVYYFNSGHFRWYLLISLIMGYTIYKSSIGIFLRFILEKTAGLFHRIFSYLIIKPVLIFINVLRMLFYPFISIGSYFIGICKTRSIKSELIKKAL